MGQIELKIANGHVEFKVNEFIRLFSGEEVDKDLIDRIKGYSRVIDVKYNDSDNYNMNEVLDEERLEKFEIALKNVRENGLTCRYQSSVIYNKGNTYYKIDQVLEATKKLNNWVNEIRNARVDGRELTPYEKFLYAYEIVTQFDYALERKGDNSSLSRHMIHILTGDKIVCAGYSILLQHILNRLDIPCSYLEMVNTKGGGGHVVCLVYLNDAKYDINGLFVSEPTWGRDKGDKSGREYYYSFLSISQAREMYKDNNLDLSDEQLYKSKKRLFASIKGKEELKLRKKQLEERKANFLKNFQGYVVDDKKFYKRMTKEIKSSIKKLKLKQNEVTKHYRAHRAYHKMEDLIKALVNDTLYELDDFYDYKKFQDKESILSDETLKNLSKSKYSVEEIAEAYIKKMKEFTSKSDKEKLEYKFGKHLADIEEISDEQANRIAEERDKIMNAKHEPKMIKTWWRGYYTSMAPALKAVGMAQGFEENKAKCYALARSRGWTDKQFDFAHKLVCGQIYYKKPNLAELELEELNDEIVNYVDREK